MREDLKLAFYKNKRDEYYAAMIDAKAIKNHELADEMHTLYNQYNNLI
tara:strand:+ start:348 stop:491 length:144 start_codon:yes stop_codon:yes gene_type:complete